MNSEQNATITLAELRTNQNATTSFYRKTQIPDLRNDIFDVLYDFENDDFKADCELLKPQNTLQISFHLQAFKSKSPFVVVLTESKPQGPLTFKCNSCKDHCIHIGVALELLSLSLLEEETFTDFDHLLFVLKGQITSKQEKQLINIELAKKDYPIPAKLKFVGVSFKAKNPLLASEHFAPLLPNCHRDDFDTEIYKTKKYNSDVWPRFFQHNSKSKQLYNDTRSELLLDEAKQLSESLHFYFSDGRYIKSNELAYHPLKVLIPKELLLQKEDLKNHLLDLNSFGGFATVTTPYLWYPAVNDTQRLILGIISRLEKNLSQANYKIFLERESAPGLLAELKSLVIDPKMGIQWRVQYQAQTDDYAVEPVGKEPYHSWLDAGNFLWDTEKKAILFQKNKALLNMPYSLCQMYPPDSGTVPHFNEAQIGRATYELRSIGYQVVFQNGTHVVPENEITTTLDFNHNGPFRITHRFEVSTGLQKGPIQLSGFSNEFLHLLYILQEGIPGYKNYQAKELASRTGPKRDLELKLLKHMGVFQYLFIELLSVVLEGTLTNGEKPKNPENVWDLLDQKIALIFFDSVFLERYADSTPSLKPFFSERVLDCFKSFSQWFIKRSTPKSYVFNQNGELILNGIYRKELLLLHTLLKLKLSEVSDSQLFKARTDILKNILLQPEVENPIYALTDKTSNLYRGLVVPTEGGYSSNAMTSLLKIQPLASQGFKFSFEGRPLEELSTADLNIQLLLENKSDENKRLGNARDWFSLHPKIFLKGKEVDLNTHLPSLQKGLIEYEGKLYLVPQGQIPNLKRLESFWLKLQGGSSLAGSGKSEKFYALPRSKVLEILALRASGVPVIGNSDWEEVCRFYDALGTSRKKIKLPKSLRAELKPYQEEGLQWLLDLHSLKLGALLADDMGLGKTLQTLSFLEVLRSKNELGNVLIVVPPSLLYNWQSEIEKFAPELNFTLLTGKNKIHSADFLNNESNSCVYVTTYGLLKEHEIIFAQKDWHIVIFDEAQNLKNISTQRTSAARSLQAQFKVCLTGTPMENHLGEFFSILDLAVPGCLDDLETFKKVYITPPTVSSEDMRYLKLKTKPLVLRRLKKEILTQLPKKTETTIVVPFESKQRKIYRDIALAYNEKIQTEILEFGESKLQLQMLTALLRLRQACSDPSALPNISYKKTPPKLEALVDAAKEIIESGESILIFTQFLSTLNKAQQLLQDEGLTTFSLHGGLSATQKKNVISEFEKTSGGTALILTLKTGGVGLNLTKASYVFHLEPWWNPAAENQATDRAHRMGQTKSVQVYRYIMHESVEEKIELLKKRKAAQFNSLFSDSEDSTLTSGQQGQKSKAGHLTKEDFALLLS